MRSLFLYNSILFLCLPFCDQKGSEKVSLLRGSALGGQNDGRHPAELARSCGSKPHWGFDRCATPQPRLRGLRGCEQGATVERGETGERAMFAPAGRITARAGLRSKLAAIVLAAKRSPPWNPKEEGQRKKS